jgi:cold shock CspA family protein
LRELGIVRRFTPGRGQGFIAIDRDRDVFFKIRDVLDRAVPRKGDRVELTVLELASGRRRAVDVRILSDG